MKGLLYKDLCILRKKCLMMLLFCGLYFVWGIISPEMSFLMNFIGIILPMMISTTISYDVASRWTRFSLAMPLSRKRIVGAKYLLLGGLVLGTFVLITLANLFYRMRSPEFALEESLAMALLICGVGLLFNLFLVPMVYRFGAERARIWTMLAGIMIACGIGFFASAGTDASILAWLENPLWRWLTVGGFWAFCLLATAVSYGISCKVYGKHAVA